MSVRSTGETVNDANDRAIVKCASFFKQSIESSGELVFISSDVGNRVGAICLKSF